MWRSLPWQSHPMVYNCGCGVVGRALYHHFLMKQALSFLRFIRFTRMGLVCSNDGSPGWVLLVATMALGSASIICILFLVLSQSRNPHLVRGFQLIHKLLLRVAFNSVMRWALMKLAPLPSVFLYILIVLIWLQIILLFLRFSILSLPFVLWVGASLSLLLL